MSKLSRILSPILRNNKVVFAGLFGSRAKNTSHAQSDYDILIQFDPKKKYTLFDLAGIKEDLEKVLRTSVDVVTPNGLDHYIKQEVLHSVIPFYDVRKR